MEIKHPTTQIIEDSVRQILTIFDEPTREGLIDTPKRVAKVYAELLTAEEPKIAIFDSKGYNQIITEKGIKYYSLCEHHMLPFFGEVHIGYIPDKHIIGISKLSRIVEYLSKRLNTQEYFTNNIANYLLEKLNAKGIGVIVSGRHLCKEMRGVKKEGTMITKCYLRDFVKIEVAKEFETICLK